MEITIGILSILDIIEVDYVISLQLDLSLTWFDRRLTMLGLHEESDLNTLTSEFKNMIWLPQVRILQNNYCSNAFKELLKYLLNSTVTFTDSFLQHQ